MSTPAPASAAPAAERPARRMGGFVQSLGLVLFGLLLSELPYIKSMYSLVTHSTRALLPAMYVRSDGPDAQCENIHAPYVPDARAYLADPATGRTAQALDYCEDVKIVESLGLVFFSCDPSRVHWNTYMGPLEDPTPRGALWLAEYKARGAPALLALDAWPDAYDFHPVGLHVLKTSSTSVRLFVVNQRGIANTVEVIDVRRDGAQWTAHYVRTVAHPLGTHTADSVLPLGPRELLVTNTHTVALRPPPRAQYLETLRLRWGSWIAESAYSVLAKPAVAPWAQWLDHLLGLGWIARVTFDDTVTMPSKNQLEAWQAGVDARVVIDGIGFANGVSAAPGLEAFVVASSTAPGVYVFPVAAVHDGVVDWDAKALFQERVFVPTPFLADNVEVVPPRPGHVAAKHDPLRGASILVAGHPSMKDLQEAVVTHGTGPRAPSWAVEISFAGGNKVLKDDDAPVPAHAHSMATPPGWRVRTLLQSNGSEGVVGGSSVALSASTTVAWDRTDGTLVFSGLFGSPPIVCRNVHGDAA